MKIDLNQYTEDVYLFNKGLSYKSYHLFGAHPLQMNGQNSIRFAVWAPHAISVEVIGDFNDWNGHNHSLLQVGTTGVWMGFFSNAFFGSSYKYKIKTHTQTLYKADPYAFYASKRPETTSIIHGLTTYPWNDDPWMKKRKTATPYKEPLNIYEVHIGSWHQSEENLFTYKELEEQLIPYVKEMGYTHIELMPIMEHPYDGSWGYQVTGYYAPTSRYGSPDDLKSFINACHNHEIAVLLDWVPGHFCTDDHGLHLFDGSMLYGHQLHPHWGTVKFDFSRQEIISFLLSNAYYWLNEFHVDGLRVDGVTSMLHENYGYSDYQPHQPHYPDAGAVEFLKILHQRLFKDFPGILMMAEESSSWPLVTHPVSHGGLGFNYKWDMGWMNDTLKYMETLPKNRRHHHEKLTFSMHYAFNENFLCSLSHDEVVHGKKSLINKMPGEYDAKFNNLELLMCYMMFHPGKKLIFMGGEFAQFIEWRHYEPLEWKLLAYPRHLEFKNFVCELNHFYLNHPPLWQIDHSWSGFTWLVADDYEHSCIAFTRCDLDGNLLLFIFNFSANYHERYRIDLVNMEDYVSLQCIFHTTVSVTTDISIGNKIEIKTYASPFINKEVSLEDAIGTENSPEQYIELTLPALSCYCYQPIKGGSPLCK